MMAVEVLYDRRHRAVPVAVERRKRGRKRRLHTRVVSVRLTDAQYDYFCVVALRAQRTVRAAMQRALRLGTAEHPDAAAEALRRENTFHQ